MPKWIRRPDDRPAELARAALEICAERGVQAAGVAEVAARAGVTVGTVYRYYRSKDALIDAALALAERPGRRDLPDRPGASIPALADILRRWGTFFAERGGHSIKVALSDPGRAAQSSMGAISDAVSEIEALVAHAIDKREMRSDISANAAARALVGALVVGQLVGASDDPHRDVETLLAVATRGLRPDGPSWKS